LDEPEKLVTGFILIELFELTPLNNNRNAAVCAAATFMPCACPGMQLAIGAATQCFDFWLYYEQGNRKLRALLPTTLPS